MGRFVSQKVVGLFVLLLLLSFLAIFLNRARADATEILEAGQRASFTELQAIRNKLGKQSNFFVAWKESLKKITNWDFGKTVKGEWVNPKIYKAFRITFILASAAAITALFVGFFLGVSGFLFPKTKKIFERLSYFILSQPVFVIAIFFLWIFSFYWPIFPPGGSDLPLWFFLPGVALGLKAASRLALFIIEFLNREQEKPYILALRNFGYSRFTIYGKHALWNIRYSLIAFWLMDVASYLAGAAIVETIFSLHGLGSLLLDALLRYDTNLIFGILCFTALLVFSISFFQEVLERKI